MSRGRKICREKSSGPRNIRTSTARRCRVERAAGPSAPLRSGRDDNREGIAAAGEIELSVEGHHHEAGHQPSHHHAHAPTRGLSEILKIIAAASISERAKQTASEIFIALGAAEAKIHNASIDDIHFHEVGAADAIVDIVCAAVGAEALGVEQFVCSPLNVGGGSVACAHGVLPVPAPATLELLRGVPIYSGDIQKELVTPTGAAIVKVIVSSFGPRPVMTVDDDRLWGRFSRFRRPPQRSADQPGRDAGAHTTPRRFRRRQRAHRSRQRRCTKAFYRGRDCDSGSEPGRSESATDRLHRRAGAQPKARWMSLPRRCR